MPPPSSLCSDATSLVVRAKRLQSCLTFCDLIGCIAHQAPLSMGFLSRDYWIGLPCPPPGNLPYPGIKPEYVALAGGFFTVSTTWEAYFVCFKSLVSNLLDTRGRFWGRQFFHRLGWWWWGGWFRADSSSFHLSHTLCLFCGNFRLFSLDFKGRVHAPMRV